MSTGDYQDDGYEPESGLAVRVGRAVIEELGGEIRNYTDLAELISACIDRDPSEPTTESVGANGEEERAAAVGTAALVSQRICEDPDFLDHVTTDVREGHLSNFAHYLGYVVSYQALHLAPQPVTSYCHVITRYSDARLMSCAWVCAAIIVPKLAGPDEYSKTVAHIKEHIAQLPEPIATEFHRAIEEVTTRPAGRVGRAVVEEAENGTRRYTDLTELILACIGKDSEESIPESTSAESDGEFALGIGTAAFDAQRICDEPGLLDQTEDDFRESLLRGFDIYLFFIVNHKLWHLAPRPVTNYRQIAAQYDDDETMARVCLHAASISRELAELEESLEILLLLKERITRLSAWLASVFHLHTGNTYRDLRKFDLADRHYRQAEEAAARAEDSGADAELAQLPEIRHQRHRLHTFYSKNPAHAPSAEDVTADADFNPNPFLPGSIINDPQSWRERPWQLLTLAQNAKRIGDRWTAHHVLTELADAAAPSDYDLLAALHHEVADLAQTASARVGVVKWHSYLAVCAAILSGNHRELGGRLSRHAARLATYSDYLAAFNLGRWANAVADQVPLYSDGIQADVAYVLYRNGSLTLAKNKYDAAIAVDLGSDFVRSQRDLVTVLLGHTSSNKPDREDNAAAIQGAPTDPPESRTLLRPTQILTARWRAAARLLTSTADVDTWLDLLMYSKGAVSEFSPVLQTLLDSCSTVTGADPRPNLFGNTPVDDEKGRVFEKLFEWGLLGMLDRWWGIPDWASAAWVLSSRTSTDLQEQIGLAIAVSAEPAHDRWFVVDSAADMPAITEWQRREVAAQVDRLLALTFLPPEAASDFGGRVAASSLRQWAATFLADHGNRLSFRLRDDPTGRHSAEIDQLGQRFMDNLSKLPLHLQMEVATIGRRKQEAIEAGPVRDIRALEQEYIVTLPEADARRLRELFASRVSSTTILTRLADRQRAEMLSWSTDAGHATLDLVQGPAMIHAVICRPSDPRTVAVSAIGLTRDQAEATTQHMILATTRSTLDTDHPPTGYSMGSPEIQRLIGGVRPALAGVTEVAVRWRAPWESIPLENIPDESGRPLSENHVVVRRHRHRPRFGIATAELPRSAEVLGDPMGNTPEQQLRGAFDEAQGVAAAFGVTAHVHDACTWDRLRASARIASLLWVSTHCEAVSGLGGMPALRLRDRWILPSEIATLEVNHGLVVVLTVCAGGRGVTLGNISEPPLAASFLTAGAELVVSPVRPIRDTVWSPLIVKALRRTVEAAGTVVDLVRTLNAMTPAEEGVGPWVMHS